MQPSLISDARLVICNIHVNMLTESAVRLEHKSWFENVGSCSADVSRILVILKSNTEYVEIEIDCRHQNLIVLMHKTKHMIYSSQYVYTTCCCVSLHRSSMNHSRIVTSSTTIH